MYSLNFIKSLACSIKNIKKIGKCMLYCIPSSKIILNMVLKQSINILILLYFHILLIFTISYESWCFLLLLLFLLGEVSFFLFGLNIKPARRESVQVGLIVPRFNKEIFLKLNCTMEKLFCSFILHSITKDINIIVNLIKWMYLRSGT